MKKRFLCVLLICVLLITLAPSALANATLDTYATGSFSRQYAVYTGPGENYVRANSGKASYGGGTARIYGCDGDWILIGYSLDSENYRIGYIPKSALNYVGNVKGSINYNLTFDYSVAYADDYCRVTDDPIMNQSNSRMLYTIPEGSAVTVLATMGKPWTYVEVQTPKGPIRGFVWSIHLKNSPYGGSATAKPNNGGSSNNGGNNNSYTPTATPRPTVQPAYSINFYHDTSKGDWLPKYQEMKLSGNWPVYSGPGEYYYRANNNKATMGGGYCRIYGVENGWMMIGYGLSDGKYRFGYIKTDALPHISLNIPYLDLKYTTRQLSVEAKLTDDIARTRNTLVKLPAKTYVLFLGYVSEANNTWAYVEVMANNSIMRGFIPASALQ